LAENTDTRYLIPNPVLPLYIGDLGGPPAGPSNPGSQMSDTGKLKMSKIGTVFILVIFSVILFAIVGCKPNLPDRTAPEIVNGVLDMSAWEPIVLGLAQDMRQIRQNALNVNFLLFAGGRRSDSPNDGRVDPCADRHGENPGNG